ncbi:MAG: hypothetical protein ACOCXZ_03765 [Chloroflexota bacterium]
MSEIQRIANERQRLWSLAARKQITPDQLRRIQEITNRLPGLWDQHRREIGTRYRGSGNNRSTAA